MEKFSNREIVSRVRGLFKSQAADSLINLPDRMLLSELQGTAIRYIRQQTDKRKLWQSPNIFQMIPCLQLKQVPLAECCGYSSDCTVARSTVKLPRIAEGSNFGMLVQGLYSIDTISRKFIESTPDRYSNSLHLGLPNKQIHWWIWENYLYIGDELIERVKLSAYFEEDLPETLIVYPGYCNNEAITGCCPAADQVDFINDMTNCCPPNPYDQEARIPGYLLSDVINEVATRLMQTYKRSQADDTNDLKDATR